MYGLPATMRHITQDLLTPGGWWWRENRPPKWPGAQKQSRLHYGQIGSQTVRGVAAAASSACARITPAAWS